MAQQGRRPPGPTIALATLGLGVAVLLTGIISSATEPTPSPSPSTAPSERASIPAEARATTSPPARVAVPLVPVTSFRAPWDSTDAAEVSDVLAGTSRRYAAVELVRNEADVALAALGQPPAKASSHLVLVDSAAILRADVARQRDRLGFLPLDGVNPSVRALDWGDVSLFGIDRIASLAAWPLLIDRTGATGEPGGVATDEPGGVAPAGETTYDPAAAWTLVAAGDVMLDRLIAYRVTSEGRGVNYPFDGGTARIAGYTCCNPVGNRVVLGRRTDHRGAVRTLLSGADLALANFENPAPDDFAYHATGYTFTADPALIEGLANAGIDWVSVANNHINNAGGRGIVETLANLDRWGIGHSGAGANLADARRASLIEAGGISVAILGYDTIRPDFAATATRPGTNEMTPARVREDIAAARNAGADLVIVFPHWGIEYTAQTTARQRQLAHAAIRAGADVVIGSHPHWAGGVEVYRGKPIFYCLGDFVFDIDLSEQTLEGIVPELTFVGTRLVQVRIHPYLILDRAQPNWLDPAGSGRVVMRQVFGASSRLPW